MSALAYTNIHRRFAPDKHVVRGVDLVCLENEYVCLLGPSGCGKSTLLRMAAGLDQPDEGDITIGGRSVVNLPPFARNVGLAFQNYALYPHLTVFGNLAFPLQAPAWKRRYSQTHVKELVTATAATLKIDHLLDRRINALSGGQQQRVALGRALVRRPSILLLDEPITHLDARLRYEMRIELKRLHQALGTATLHVTHDQREALALADRIAIMRNGRIEQIGAPMELYNDPATDFVAGFIGDPPTSIFDGTIESRGADTAVWLGGVRVGLPSAVLSALLKASSTKVRVGIRSRDISVAAPDEAQTLTGTVFSHERTGQWMEIAIDTAHGRARLRTDPGQTFLAGKKLQLRLNSHKPLFFSGDDGKRIVDRVTVSLDPAVESVKPTIYSISEVPPSLPL